MAIIKCPECGKKISDKAEMCINCGFNIKTIQQSVNDIEIDSSDEKTNQCLLEGTKVKHPFFKIKKIKLVLLTVVLPIVLIAALLIGYFHFFKSDSNTVVLNVEELIEKGEYTTAYYELLKTKNRAESSCILKNFEVLYEGELKIEYSENGDFLSKKEYKRNKYGDLISMIEYDEYDNVIEKEEHEYEYDQNGNMIRDIHYVEGEPGDIIYHDYIYHVEEAYGYPEQDNYYESDDLEINFCCETEIEYYENGNIKRSVQCDADGNIKEVKRYNLQGKIITEEDDDGQTRRYEYNAEGDLTQILNYFEGELSTKEKYSVDENGNRTCKKYLEGDHMIAACSFDKYGNIIYVADEDDGVLFESEYKNKYDKNGYLVSSVVISKVDGVKEDESERKYKYDKYGNLLMGPINYDVEGNPVYPLKYKYEYDKNHNIIAVVGCYKNGSETTLAEYQYDKNGVVLRETTYNYNVVVSDYIYSKPIIKYSPRFW